jgi:hypothetical protein
MVWPLPLRTKISSSSKGCLQKYFGLRALEQLAAQPRKGKTMSCVVEAKFSVLEVASLRDDLLHRGLDSFQVAETIKMFLARRGYGVSAEMARDAASKLEDIGYTVECFRKWLETLALVM